MSDSCCHPEPSTNVQSPVLFFFLMLTRFAGPTIAPDVCPGLWNGFNGMLTLVWSVSLNHDGRSGISKTIPLRFQKIGKLFNA